MSTIPTSAQEHWWVKMVKDYMRFLAVHVINESKIVCLPDEYRFIHTDGVLQISYRMLSRELKVHCNAAKRCDE